MNIFITGANRGIGLEFVKQYTSRGERVLAGCRNPEKAKKLRRLLPTNHIISLDIADSNSISESVTIVKQHFTHLNLFINNAGIIGKKGNPESINQEDMLDTYNVNAVGPVILTKQLKSLLVSGAKVVNISSQMGSIEDNSSGGYYAYRMSKAALNMASKNLYLELRKKEIIVLALHPGWVRTDMGGIVAPLSVKKSVNSMIDVIDDAKYHQSGQFLRYDGDVLPW
ncbi:MAG: SDR family oxidoreductase [Candidatus Marinimicrobia bacterium]|nr:SDR family oxidoreductase [Candidatus Neomarinimicrobiota bacterium]